MDALDARGDADQGVAEGGCRPRGGGGGMQTNGWQRGDADQRVAESETCYVFTNILYVDISPVHSHVLVHIFSCVLIFFPFSHTFNIS
jgi:hypothetical protein